MAHLPPSLLSVIDADGLALLDARGQDAIQTLPAIAMEGAHVLDVSLVQGHAYCGDGRPFWYWVAQARSAHEGLVRAAWEQHAGQVVAVVHAALATALALPSDRLDLSLSARSSGDAFVWSWKGHVWTTQTQVAFAPQGQGGTPAGALESFLAHAAPIFELSEEERRARLA